VTLVLLALLRLPPDAGEIDQETPAPAGSLLALPSICRVPPAWIVALFGETETAIARTVTVMDADLELSVAEVALSVTVRSLGGRVLGAV
jgi:hypothetical protein